MYDLAILMFILSLVVSAVILLAVDPSLSFIMLILIALTIAMTSD